MNQLKLKFIFIRYKRTWAQLERAPSHYIYQGGCLSFRLPDIYIASETVYSGSEPNFGE